MRRYHRLSILAAACIALLVVPGHAQESPSYTAYEVMKGCRASVERNKYQDDITSYWRGFCAGTVHALTGTAAALESKIEGSTRVCPPRKWIVGQAIRVVAAYIDARPYRLQESFQLLAMEALREAWPCQR